MKINLSEKVIAYLALFSGLTISAVAIWYSVAGLVSIFAATVVPIIVMGVALEVSKLIATVWLKLNWSRAPVFIRSYLLGAIAILMVITSMGIFGFLSKAHSDQSLVSGDVQAKIAVYDEKIKTSKDNIEANRKALQQMDTAVDQVMSRSTTEGGADKAVAIRRSQQKERARLQAEIASEQRVIAQQQELRAPIAAEVRKVEAEVGPIKYIAAFIYGDNPDANVLEKAVTWVIIIIVSVFDPLAVILLLASQYSFQWFRKQEEEQKAEGDSPIEPEPVVDNQLLTVAESSNEPKYAPIVEERDLAAEGNAAIAEIEPEEIEYIIEDADEESVEEPEVLEDADEDIQNNPPHIKVAMSSWKLDNPEDSLKHQRKLLEDGVIKKLPWELPPYTLEAVDDATVEAIKWAAEQMDRPGDYLKEQDKETKTWLEMDGNRQVRKSTDELVPGYEQNAEQNAQTLWSRIQASKK